MKATKLHMLVRIITSGDPRRCRCFTVEGGAILPGLIDLHVHIGVLADRLFMTSPHELTARTLPKLRDVLMGGFTTVRECGGIGVYLKSCQEEGVIASPRIWSAGKAIFQTGGHGDMTRAMLLPDSLPKNALGSWSLIADGVAEVRQACRRSLSQGADFIKIATSAGVNSNAKTVNKIEYTEDEVRAAVEEADNYGTYVSAHAVSNGGIKLAARCGVRTIEHAQYLDHEAVEEIAKAGAYVIPTFGLSQVQYDARDTLDPIKRDKIKAAHEEHCRTFSMLLDAGVPIGVGTDFWPGPDNAMELELLVELGMTPMEVIQASTKIAADVLMSDRLGVLEKGKLADVLLVQGNPLKDIRCLRNPDNVKIVIQDGKIVKNLI